MAVALPSQRSAVVVARKHGLRILATTGDPPTTPGFSN